MDSKMQILTQSGLNKVSAKVTDRIRARIGQNSKITFVKQGIVVRKSTNEVILLVTVQTAKNRRNPLFSDLNDQSNVNAYLAIVNLDEVEQQDNANIQKVVRVHKITFEKVTDQQGRWGFTKTENLDFEPVSIALNRVETAFVVYGKGGILVGNLPSSIENMRHLNEEQQKDLSEPATDLPISAEVVSQSSFQDEDEDKETDIIQVEFNQLNNNYLNVLTQREDSNKVQNNFKVINLAAEGMPAEIDYNLSVLPPRNTYGQFNKNLKFVSFAQCPNHSSDYFTLDIFQVHFLTENGHLYSVCPLLLQQMVFREEHFSQIILLLGDQIQELRSEGKSAQAASQFKMALIESKQGIKNRPGFCSVTLSKEKQDQLRPQFQGPLRVQNSSRDEELLKFQHLQTVCSFPFSLIKVNNQQLTLLVTFDQPEFKFKSQEDLKDNSLLVQVSEHELPQAIKSDPDAKLWLSADVTDEFVYYLHTQTQRQSNLFKLDLSSLEKVSTAFEEDQEVDFAELKQMKAMKPSNSEGASGSQFTIYNNFLLGFDPQSLTVKLHSQEVLYQDQSEAFIARLKQANQKNRPDFVPDEFDWKPPTDWIRQIRISDSIKEEDDIPMDEFKQFSTAFLQNYFGHFDRIENVFNKRIELLAETKQTLLSKAKETKKLQDENSQTKREIEEQLKQVQKQNEDIQTKLKSIQSKIKALTCQYPDDFVLQQFIKMMAKKVKDRKDALQSCVERSQNAIDFDNQMQRNVQDLKNVDPEVLKQLQSFVVLNKPRVQELKQKVQELQID